MAIVGLSNPIYSIYGNVGTNVYYYGGGSAGKAVEWSIELEENDDNSFYADNGVAESYNSFAGGTLTISTDDLTQEVSKAILGVTERSLSDVPGITDENAAELVFDDNQTIPYLGYGVIVKHIKDNQTLWTAIALNKIIFSNVNDTATTQGETIEWQAPELTATIMRDDSETHGWKKQATFTTQAQAIAYLNYALNVGAAQPTLGSLSVQSAAGTADGTTALTVTPKLTAGNRYMIQVASTVTLPTDFGEAVSTSWTSWDGTSDVTATTGNEVGVVEVSTTNQAIKAGKTTVTAKEAG